MMNHIKKYRLGLDLGSTSLGWCMLELDEMGEACDLIDMGVRIFSDGRDDKSKMPLSVKRRIARGIRRNHDRYLERRKKLLSLMVDNKMLKNNAEENKEVFMKNPYQLRSKGLYEELSLSEFARAILHLAQRRGYKSNRKDNTKDSLSMKTAIENSKSLMLKYNAKSMGELQYKIDQAQKIQHKKDSIRFKYEKKSEKTDLLFPSRSMIEDEFNLIWDTQKKFHSALNDHLKKEFYDTIFYQRPLKPQIPGNCYLIPDHQCAPKASLYFQEFRLLSFLNNLKLIEIETGLCRELSDPEYQKLFEHLSLKDKTNYETMRKQMFGKNDNYNAYRFNYEKSASEKVYGNEVNALFQKKELKPIWQSLDFIEKENIINQLLSHDLNDEQVSANMKKIGFNTDQIELIFSLNLPKGYGNLCIEAMNKIIHFLKQRQKYDEAAKSAGFNHSTKFTGEIFDEGNLPYYGELLPHRVIKSTVSGNHYKPKQDTNAFFEQKFGKINNPSVHIALNQTQKLINALSKKYGGPTEIVLELARELTMSLDKYKEYEKKLKVNTANNERIRELLVNNDIDPSRENIQKYQLWEELNQDIYSRCCVYSGKPISFNVLFTDEVQIEHILPFSRTYDDSRSNKTLSYRSANIFKDNQTPYEAFFNAKDYNWSEILVRAEYLPYSKRRRFSADAMDRFKDDNDPIARMLTDTQYMSRIAAEYLKHVCGEYKVWSVKGSVTAQLRYLWGLNSILSNDNTKNRNDHRHHAVDAFAIACATHSVVKAMAHYQIQKKKGISNLVPFKNYNSEKLIKKVMHIYVSFKPEQSNPKSLQKYNQTAGQLLEDTAWNYYKPVDKKFALFTIRKSIEYFEDSTKCEKIIDPLIRKTLISFCDDKGKIDGEKLNQWAEQNGVKKIKISDKMGLRSMVSVADKSGKLHKFYSSAENLYSDVYLEKPWDPKSNWGIEHITSYNAHQQNFVPEWKKTFPFAKLLFRVFKNDYIILSENDTNTIYRIKKMSKCLLFLENIYKSVSDKDNSFSANKLKSLKARKGGVDIIGRLNDPMRE